jgi:hypothetical protein
MDDIYEIAQLILHSQSFMIKLETRVNAQMHLTTLTNKGAPHSAMASPAAVSAISLLVRVLWPVPISGDDKRNGGCQVHGSRSRRIGGWYLLQESPAEVELSDLSLHIQTPERVGVDDADID